MDRREAARGRCGLIFKNKKHSRRDLPRGCAAFRRKLYHKNATARPIITGMVGALSKVSRATRLEARDLSPS